jgi:hypothetical protein
MNFMFVSLCSFEKRLKFKPGVALGTIVTLCAITFGANAQLQWGIKAGVNMASANYYSATQMKLGFHAGVAAKIQLNQKFYFVPEIIFTNRGFSFVRKDQTDFNYIEVPCQISYQFMKKFDFRVGANFVNKVTPELGIKAFFYGLSLGSTLQLTEDWSFSLRYNRDFAPLVNDSSGWSLFYSVGYYIKSHKS